MKVSKQTSSSSDNPSGQKGLLGKIADTWDQIPVKGVMGGLVAVLGAVLAFSNGGFAKSDCAKTPLEHVYKPSRLQVIATCQDITGTVIAFRHEHDGDYHVSMKMDKPGWVNDVNKAKQHGYTVVEFVPLMPKPDGFFVGQRLRLRTTKILDNQHGGWIEGHPVFAYQDVTPPQTTPQPNRPALAPATER